MPLITDATNEWSAGVTLTADEVWQARSGWIRISTAASPGADDGIVLRGDRGDALQISSGKTVKYKISSGAAPFVLSREEV